MVSSQLLADVLLSDCLRVILQYLSLSEELRFSHTSSRVRNLLYIWRHWSLCGLPCLSWNIHSFPPPFHPMNRLLIPNHGSHSISNFKKEVFDRCYLKFTDQSGWGVYASKVIQVHEIVDFYAGELITTRESFQRYMSYDRQRLNYILTIREESPPNRPPITLTTNVDATYLGNFSRFFNHSCDPNLFVVMHRPSPKSPLAVPFFISTRTIAPSEQLTFDYGSSSVESEPANPIKKLRTDYLSYPFAECHCGSSNCRLWLPTSL